MSEPTNETPPEKAPSRAGDFWIGTILFLVGGFIIAISQGWIPSDPKSMHAPAWVILVAGGIFFIAGFSFFLRPWASATSFIGSLILTGLASIGLWVAFGPGSRQFKSTGSFLFSDETNQSLGKIVFGLGGILTALFALFAWLIFFKSLFKQSLRVGIAVSLLLAALASFLIYRSAPRFFTPAVSLNEKSFNEIDDLYFAAVDAKIKSPNYLKWKKGEQSWLSTQEFAEEFAIQSIRSDIASRVVPPLGAPILKIPTYSKTSLQLAHDFETVMKSGVLIQPNEGAAATLALLYQSDQLWIAFDAIGETTEKGFDQARFFYHCNLLPSLPWEAIYQSASGDPSILRSGPITDSNLFAGSKGSSALTDHRRYLISLPIKPAGLHLGIPFAARAEIETDPLLHENGKFKSRVHLAEFGKTSAPLWLVIGNPAPSTSSQARALDGSPPQNPSELESPPSTATTLREALEIKLATKSYQRWMRMQRPPQNFPEEQTIKTFRDALIAARKPNPSPLTVPLCQTPPKIDGTLSSNEWSQAKKLTIHSSGTTLALLADSTWLYVAVDAPGDTTLAGWDQLRLYFHHQLTHEFHHERLHLSPGHLSSIREIQLPIHPHSFSDYHIDEKSRGAVGYTKHRQYELAVNRLEAGIPSNVPIAFSVELETDPKEVEKRRERVLIGDYGSKTEPQWILIP